MRYYIKLVFYKILGLKGYLVFSSTVLAFGNRLRLWRELKPLKHLVMAGDYCLDIGANLGFYTIALASRTGPTGKVVAVEPLPFCAREVKRWVSNWHMDWVEVLNVALAPKQGNGIIQMPFFGGVPMHTRSSLAGKVKTDGIKKTVKLIPIRVKLECIDKLFSKFPHLEYIKMDVEGYEKVLIPRITPYLRKYQSILQAEISKHCRKECVDAILDALKDPLIFVRSKDRLLPVSYREALNKTDDLYFVPGKHQQRIYVWLYPYAKKPVKPFS